MATNALLRKRNSELLEAAHIVPVANGLLMSKYWNCAVSNPPQRIRQHYFTFEPGSRKLILEAGLTTSQLLNTKEILDADINDECLALRQRLFNTEARY